MKLSTASVILGFIVASSASLVAIAEKRADYWLPVYERVSSESDSAKIKTVSVMLFKGCGWSLGETVTAKGFLSKTPMKSVMCRSRNGRVEMSVTTYENRVFNEGN